MSWRGKSKKETISEEEWEVVKARLKTMPDNMRLGILSNSFNKQELLLEVQNKSEIGGAYVEMQMEFIRWLAKQSRATQS